MNSSNLALQPSIFGKIELEGPGALDYHLDIAGIGARSHAFLIDWHIRLLLAVAWFTAMGLSLFSLQELLNIQWDQVSTLLLFIWLAPVAVIYFLYHPLLELLMAGRTPGKRMAGIRIATLQGMTPNASAILIRNVFRLLDSLPGLYILGLATVAFTRHQVRIGDLAGGLVLVYDNKVSHKQLQKATDLALTSELSTKDQALLLDLLARWKQLDLAMQISLGDKFLHRIGHPLPAGSDIKKIRSKEIHQQLEQLTNPQHE